MHEPAAKIEHVIAWDRIIGRRSNPATVADAPGRPGGEAQQGPGRFWHWRGQRLQALRRNRLDDPPSLGDDIRLGGWLVGAKRRPRFVIWRDRLSGTEGVLRR